MTSTQDEHLKAVVARIEARFNPHYGIDGASDSRQLAEDCRTLIASLPAPDTAGKPVVWFNGCDRTVPEALRFLAFNDRPSGGEQRFNAAHLHQLAGEIEHMSKKPLYAAPQAPATGRARIKYADHAAEVEAVQQMIEQGCCYVDSEGYLTPVGGEASGIVAWLRGMLGSGKLYHPGQLADAIERGEHLAALTGGAEGEGV